MANQQETQKKESQNPNTLRTIKELLKEYKTADNSKTLAPLKHAISENKERQLSSSWKHLDPDNKSAIQKAGMMSHQNNTTDDNPEATSNQESKISTTPNPTHHENSK